MAKSDITKLGKDVCWQDVTRGNTIVGSGTTREFITGDWTAVAPVIDEEKNTKTILKKITISKEDDWKIIVNDDLRDLVFPGIDSVATVLNEL